MLVVIYFIQNENLSKVMFHPFLWDNVTFMSGCRDRMCGNSSSFLELIQGFCRFIEDVKKNRSKKTSNIHEVEKLP